MVLSLLLTSLLTIGISPNMECGEEAFLKEEITDLKEPYSSTYLTNRNTYISFYSSTILNDVDSEDDEMEMLSIGNYSGSSYIRNKYFEVGYSNTYTSNLLVGKSSIIGPDGYTPTYQTVYGLILPNINTNIYSIRGAGFCYKKQSGNLNSVLSYLVNSPSYTNINGTSTINKTSLGSVSLSSSYSTIDITDEIIDAYDNSQSELNILLLSNISNKTCYLYGVDASIFNAPYFYIEYDNYGNTREYYEGTSSVNCYGYSLFLSSGRDIDSNLAAALGTENIYNNGNTYSLVINALITILASDGCTNIQSISSYDSQIYSNQRRIAFRMKLVDIPGSNPGKQYGGEYHFMWQTLNGYWAEQMGFNPGVSGVIPYINAPSQNSSWHSSYQDCPTYYFAITKN